MNEGMSFYRCLLCHGVVSPWDIRAGGCPKCGGVRIQPADLTTWEKLVQIVKHPKLWTWGENDLRPNE